MKVNNVIKTLLVTALLFGTAITQANQEYAKVLFEVPDKNLKICAHYDIKDAGFNINLYEANAHNLKYNQCVGYIGCMTNKDADFAYIAITYVIPEAREKKYSRLLSQVAFEEFAKQGFKKVSFLPQQVEAVKTETLRSIYTAGGSQAGLGDMMEYDISALSDMPPEPFEDVFDDLMYYKKLIRAAQNGNLKEVKRVLNKQIDPITKKETFKVNPNAREEFTGTTALMYAAEHGHADVVNYLLTEAHADPNMQDASGGSLFTYMIAKGADSEEIRSVIRRAKLTSTTRRAAIDYARKRGRSEVVKILEAAGVSGNGQKAKL